MVLWITKMMETYGLEVGAPNLLNKNRGVAVMVPHITLENPLLTLAFSRLGQRHDPCSPRVQMFHETLDDAALAGGIASLKQDDDLLAGLLDPFLHFEQLNLQHGLVFLVGVFLIFVL